MSVSGKGQLRLPGPIWALPSGVWVTSAKLNISLSAGLVFPRRDADPTLMLAFNSFRIFRVKSLNVCEVLSVVLYAVVLIHLFPFLATVFV